MFRRFSPNLENISIPVLDNENMEFILKEFKHSIKKLTLGVPGGDILPYYSKYLDYIRDRSYDYLNSYNLEKGTRLIAKDYRTSL